MGIAAFITVRLGSTRLPRKALKEVKGKPILWYLVEQVKTVKGFDHIVLCTTDKEEDKPLVGLAQEAGIDWFCGDAHDIIKRHYMAAKHFKVDFIVNVDGDDIFCDPGYMQKVVDHYKTSKAEVIKTEGLPLGANTTGYTFRVLEDVFRGKAENNTETGWGEYFTQNPAIMIETIKAHAPVFRPEIRMTLDYEEDFKFFKVIIENLYDTKKHFMIEDIIKLLDKKPDILNINKHLNDVYWSNFNSKKVRRNE